MKLFISQPMANKTEKEIMNEREYLIAYAKKHCGEDLEVIDSYIKDAPKHATPLWWLGKSFELLSTADVCIFAKGWDNTRGCYLEHEACMYYRIKTLEVE